MSTSRAIFGLLLGGAVLIGCKKEETPPAPPAPVVTPSSSTPAPTVVAPATPTPPTITPPTITPPTVTAPTPPTGTVPPVALPALPGDSKPVTTTTPTGGASAADAKALLADAATNVSNKKWDAAGDDFKKLAAMRSQLSPDLQKEIDDAEAKFVAAKAGVSLPSIPGLGGSTPAPDPNK